MTKMATPANAADASEQRPKRRKLPPLAPRATEDIAHKVATWLTVQEVMERLGCYSEPGVYLLVRRGVLRGERIRLNTYIDPASVEVFMESELYLKHAALCA